MQRVTTTAILAATIAMSTLSARADEHVVEMLNRDPETREIMVFKPAVLKIAPGDSVTFKAVHNGHNAELIAGLAPAGAAPFRGGINEDITVTFTEEGAYAYKCLPHFATGMVGIILVGDSTAGLDEIAAAEMPGTSKTRRDAYVAIARGL